MKARVKESPEGGAPAPGEAAPLRGDCAGVSISAATERRGGTASSISSVGCLRKPATLRGRLTFSQLSFFVVSPHLQTGHLRAPSSNAKAMKRDVAFLPRGLIVAG